LRRTRPGPGRRHAGAVEALRPRTGLTILSPDGLASRRIMFFSSNKKKKKNAWQSSKIRDTNADIKCLCLKFEETGAKMWHVHVECSHVGIYKIHLVLIDKIVLPPF